MSSQPQTDSQQWAEVRNGTPAGQTLSVTNDATVWYCYTTRTGKETITIYKREDGEKVIHVTSSNNNGALSILGTNIENPDKTIKNLVEEYKKSETTDIVTFAAKTNIEEHKQ